jgi:hypothetical protein
MCRNTFPPGVNPRSATNGRAFVRYYQDEKKEALEHLDFAIKAFHEMKMKPSLERALRHKDILKA